VIKQLKRHAIHVLRAAGHTVDEIVGQVQASRSTVKRVMREPMPTDLVERAPEGPEGVRPVGRPTKAEAYRAQVVQWLAEDPALRGVEVFRRAQLAGYTGAKSALYELLRAVRVTLPRPVVRFEGLPGEFTQHDFGEVVVRYLDGTTERIHFFASRLKYSRWVEVTVVPDQRVERLARTLVAHFVAMGGIPLLAVFDRPKTVALKWKASGEVTEWNPVFSGVVLDLGLGVEVLLAVRPPTKGGGGESRGLGQGQLLQAASGSRSR
jgi:transposase